MNGTLVPRWPDLPLDAWQDTKDTLQLFSQVVGKIRLAFSPPEPEWAHVVLYAGVRGLTTGPIPYGDRTFQISFDFLAHKLVFETSDDRTEMLDLRPQSVADFYEDVLATLDGLAIATHLNPVPQEVPDTTPFDEDSKHKSYDREAVGRFWQILRMVDTVFREHRASFRGRHTPVQFFWGGFDLAYTRYRGTPAAPPAGAPKFMQEAMDAEEIYAGFWPGDARLPEPAFGAYVYPKPDGLEHLPVRPKQAAWNAKMGLFILRYADVRASDAPAEAIREFLRSTYDTCAACAKWEGIV